MKKAVGQRGSWFAVVDGERLPVLHNYWVRREGGDLVYHDVNLIPELCDTAQRREFMETLRDGTHAVLAKSGPSDPNDTMKPFVRSSYIAVFAYEFLSHDDHGLRLRLTDRTKDLK